MLFIVEIEVSLEDNHNARRADLFRVIEAFGKPVQIRRFTGGFFNALAIYLGLRTRLTIDPEVRVIVVGTLYVQADVNDRAVIPANILRVLRVIAAFARFASELQLMLAEAV